MSQKKTTSRRSKNNNNNNDDDASTSSIHDTKGLACLRCKEKKKRCNRVHPTCDRCLKSGHQCLYRMKFDSAVYNRYTPESLQQLESEVYQAEQLGKDLEGEILRQLEEIERMKKAKNQLVVRSVTLYKCSQLIYMLNCYMPALQPTTGNQVPYIKISHFFKDTNPARQGAMFAMLANAALMLEDTRLANRFRLEANKCLLDAGDPTPQNMALYVSALIDLGTHHQAFFDFETAIKFYYQIKGFADRYPQLFLAALRKKRNNQHSLVYQDHDRVKELQEKEHYSGRFQNMSRKESPDGAYDSNNSSASPGLSNNNNAIEEDDSSDSDLPPEDDGKTTYAVASYALPKTAEESLLFHLGYAFEALMLMTRDKELDMIRKEIEDSNSDKLGEHNVFNEIRERLHALNQIATYCLKKGLIMQWEWFNAELAYVEKRMEEVEFGRRIFLFGQKKLVNIHGLMASKKKEAAMAMLEELILLAQDQFYYGKTNVLGYGYLFSACVCYRYLQEYALFDQTRDLVASYRVPGLLLAERCLEEIDKYVVGQTAKIAPYFAKLAAILEAEHPEQTKFYLFNFTDPQTGEMTVAGKSMLPESLHDFKGHVAYTNNNNNNNSISQAQALSLCESNSGSFSYEEPADQQPAMVHQYSNNNNTNSKHDVYDAREEYMDANLTHHDFGLVDAAEDLEIMMQHDESPIELQTNAYINHLGVNMNRAPHLEHNHQLFNNNNNHDESVFYVYDQEYNNNNTIGHYTMGDHQHVQEEHIYPVETDQHVPHPIHTEQHLQQGYYFPVEE